MPKARNNDATAPPPKGEVKVRLRPEYHRRLRHLAVDADTSASRLAQQVIEAYLDSLDAKTPDVAATGVEKA